MDDFPTHCFECKGPWHPSTGDYDKKWNIAFCEGCIKTFYKWMRQHTKRKWGGYNFYEEAQTSIKAKCSK